jgi:hypothetical protein
MTVWAILNELCAAGHDVLVIALRYPNDPFTSSARESAVAGLGVRLATVPVPAVSRRGVGRILSRLFDVTAQFEARAVRPAVLEHLREYRPQGVFIYHWDSLAVLHGDHEFPKLGAVGDPWHLPALRTWQHERAELFRLRYWKRSVAISLDRWIQPRRMAELLADCDAAGTFQHAETLAFQRLGLRDCAYYRTAVSDPNTAGVTGRTTWVGTPTILLGPSNLEATSTRHGLVLFAEEVLPRLEGELGPGGFHVRVVGEGRPPPELARLLPRSNVSLLGRVEPPDDEFRGCAVQLVPTPFVLGIRVRVVTGMAFGCCIVAHASEAANIPELRSGDNCLIGASGAELAKHLIGTLRNSGLRRRLGEAARRDYEKHFQPSVAVRPIITQLRTISGHYSASHRPVNGATPNFG